MSDKQLSVEDFKWIRDTGQKGERLFTLDGNRIYNLFQDQPYELSKEEKRIFDEVNPFWADFFKERNNEQ